jgi:hypothetical protein
LRVNVKTAAALATFACWDKMTIQAGRSNPDKSEQNPLSYESEKKEVNSWLGIACRSIQIHWPHSPAKARGHLLWIFGHSYSWIIVPWMLSRWCKGHESWHAGDPNLAIKCTSKEYVSSVWFNQSSQGDHDIMREGKRSFLKTPPARIDKNTYYIILWN